MKPKQIWPAIAAAATVVVLASCGTPTRSAVSPMLGTPDLTSAAPSSPPSSQSPAISSPATGARTTGAPATGARTSGTPRSTGAPRSSSNPTSARPSSLGSPARCVTSSPKGSCGPYHFSGITASGGSNTYVLNNMWAPNAGTTQTLRANGPDSWSVTANSRPAGYTGVQTYPDTQQIYTRTDNTPDPLSGFASIISSFTETMNASGGTSAEAAYDIWLGQNTATNYADEVMIWNDQANRGTCGGATVRAHASFGGSHGVPQQNWTLCKYGSSELIWYLTSANEQSGIVDVLSMLTWLEGHGYLPAGSGLNQIDYGFEICSTPGPKTFTVDRFAIRSKCTSGASC